VRPSLRALVLVFILLLSVEASSASEADRLIDENSLLKAELQLAGSSKIYVLLDLPGKKMEMKAKGILLKELPVESYSQWGTPVPPRPLPLLRKTALVKPERKEIKPGTEDAGKASEPEVLKLEDMPVRYQLQFDDRIQISVKPKSTGMISTVFNLAASLKSCLITRPMGTLWNGLHRQSFTEIAVVLDENDARSLYWSFHEGFQCIVIWNDSGAETLPQGSPLSGEDRSPPPIAIETFSTGEGQVLFNPQGNP
jgi:hypothetical protein